MSGDEDRDGSMDEAPLPPPIGDPCGGSDAALGDGDNIDLGALIEATDPAYTRRDIVPGLGVRIVFDLERVRIETEQHVMARVRARTFFPNSRLALRGPASLLEPEYLGSGRLRGGFEHRYVLPRLPAGRIAVDFYGRTDDAQPMATTTVFVSPPAAASLLANRSFERDFGDPPAGWTRWEETSDGHSAPGFGYERFDDGGSEVRHGGQAIHFTTGWGTHRAGLWQRVPLGATTIGCRARFSAAVRTWDKQELDWTPERCGFGSFRALVGVDPTGGTDPSSNHIVWQDTWDACPDFVRLSAEATIEGDAVTVYLKSAPKWPAQLNRSHWDDTRMEVLCD